MSSTLNEKPTFLAKTANYVDERAGVGGGLKFFGRKIFPDHWSFMLGEVALYSFVILVISGTFLTFWYQPSMVEVEYQGAYAPLKGAEMSIAYASSLDISFEIRGGAPDEASPPLVCLAVCGRLRVAHVARFLHRCIPQTSRN